MKRLLSSGLLLGGLAVLQSAILIRREVETVPPDPPAELAVGDPVAGIDGLWADSGEQGVTLVRDDGQWTVVLAFHSQCVWCDRAAPMWAEWLSQPRDARVLAVTRDNPRSAVEYANRHGWAIDVLIVPQTRGTIEHRLTSRTPWVYVFDDGGVLHYEGNGALLDTVEAVLDESRSEPAP